MIIIMIMSMTASAETGEDVLIDYWGLVGSFIPSHASIETKWETRINSIYRLLSVGYRLKTSSFSVRKFRNIRVCPHFSSPLYRCRRLLHALEMNWDKWWIFFIQFATMPAGHHRWRRRFIYFVFFNGCGLWCYFHISWCSCCCDVRLHVVDI